MQKVIYIDVFIVTNMLIDFALLKATAALVSVRIARLRLFAASLAASASSLIILLPELRAVWLILLKIAVATLICAAAFGFRSFGFLVRTTASFLLVNVVFGGSVYLFANAFSAPVLINNMSFYFDSSPLYLLCVVTVVYLAISAGFALWRNRMPEKTSVDLKMRINGCSIAVGAFVDTGHKLIDAVSGRAVLIVSRKKIAPALTGEQLELLDRLKGGEVDAEFVPRARFRLIPYSDLGGAGNLVAFFCEYCDVKRGARVDRLPGPLVAVADFSDFEAVIAYDTIKNL